MCESLTSITIPDSVTTIGIYVFSYCNSLTSITIPDNITTIGEGAFYRCKSLASITLGDSVTIIGDETFYECTNLTNITLPDSVTTIGTWAFRDCRSLTSITIGNSVTTIGTWPFTGCKNLTIYGYLGSTSEKYANQNNIPFVALEEMEEPDEYTILFIRDGKDVTVTKTEGETLEKSEIPEIEVDESEEFKGWTLTEGSEYVDFTNNDLTADVVENIFSDLKVYLYPVVVENNAYTVIFAGKGEVTKYDPYVVLEEFEVPEDPEKENYIFKGWSLNPEATEGEDRYYFLDKPISALVGTWYPVFEEMEEPEVYTITFALSGADAVVTKTEGEKLTKNEIPVLGFVNVYPKPVFYGWALTYGSKNVDFTNDVLVSDTVENLFSDTDVVLYPVTYLLGDINCDGKVDADDAILLLQHSLFPDLYPVEYKGSADMNNDGTTDLNDAILLLQYSMFPDIYPIN